MNLDINFFVETVEHQEHRPDGFDHCVGDALGCIRQQAQNKRTYALSMVNELETQILDHLNVDVLVSSLGIGIVKSWGVNQCDVSDCPLLGTGRDRLERLLALEVASKGFLRVIFCKQLNYLVECRGLSLSALSVDHCRALLLLPILVAFHLFP